MYDFVVGVAVLVLLNARAIWGEKGWPDKDQHWIKMAEQFIWVEN